MKPPKFWYAGSTGFNALALSPLASVYRFLSERRWAKGAHVKMDVPVICVGNINLGGTGKTPTAIYLSLKLNKMDKNVHVVTRGYGGHLQGPVRVDINKHTADDVGDEPILLAGFAPTWVAKDRLAGVRSAIDAGAQCIILDDGMQNPAVHKDLTILVVDSAVGFGNERIFPAGPLRESVQSGVAKANVVLAIGGERAAKTLVKDTPMLNDLPVLSGQLDVLQTGMDWQGLRALAFAGIGRPEKFYNSLRSAGVEIIQTRSFGDHQKLPVAILKRLEAEAWQVDAQLVTTEKDAARLPKDWQQKVLTLPVRLSIDHDEVLDARLAAMAPAFRDAQRGPDWWQSGGHSQGYPALGSDRVLQIARHCPRPKSHAHRMWQTRGKARYWGDHSRAVLVPRQWSKNSSPDWRKRRYKHPRATYQYVAHAPLWRDAPMHPEWRSHCINP
ncbi:UNVERIFIED_CONTAM: hypothetical protein GTU68_055881 [Idotea baltica]|nr:hypothetical protein [Idotea baltica]